MGTNPSPRAGLLALAVAMASLALPLARPARGQDQAQAQQEREGERSTPQVHDEIQVTGRASDMVEAIPKPQYAL